MQVIQNLERITGYSSIITAFERVRDSRDPNAMRFCLELVKPLVAGVVNLYVGYAVQKELGSRVSREDLQQSAYEALIKEMTRFRPPDGAGEIEARKAWNTYAGLIIKGPVRESYASSCGQVETPEWALKISKKINRALHEMEVEHFAKHDSFVSWKVDHVELARRSRTELSKVKRFMASGFFLLPQARFQHLDHPETGNDRAHELQSHAGAEEDSQIHFTPEQKRLMDHIWRILPRRERDVLSMRYGLDGPPKMVKEIAEEIGVTRKAVSAIEKRALAQIREILISADEYETLHESLL